MQAYDLKALVEKLKEQGLDVAEAAAGGAVKAVVAWLSDSVKASATPFDDVALVVLPKLEQMALEAIDKIDGVQGA